MSSNTSVTALVSQLIAGTITIVLKTYKLAGVIKHQLLISLFGYSYHCKHYPTCSQYTINQIREHGTIVGLLLGLWRLSRCW